MMQAGIIGGTGRMGQVFAAVLRRAGHSVVCSGRTTPLSNSEIAKSCDLVMVSVPIRETVRVISEIAPYLTSDQILCDLTSLKEEPVRAMLESKAQVVGLHPMFGPTVASLRRQRIIVTPARCDEDRLESLLQIFRNEGAQVTVTSPETHDRMMAVIQGLTHFTTLCMADALRRMDVDIGETLSLTSPVYRIHMGLIGRLLSQDAALYGDMLTLNPYVPAVLSRFREAACELEGIVGQQDIEGLLSVFEMNTKPFEAFLPSATAETDALIACMVER